MRLKATVNRQSLRDVPGPTGNAGNFPTIEPDGTSTSNPTLFPGPIYLDTFDNFYVGALDWVVSPKLFANVTVGLYDYGTHGGGAGEQLRHVFTHVEPPERELQFPEIPDSLRFVSGYADFPSSSVTKYDDFKRNSVNARRVVLRQQVGPALDQGRVPVRAHRQLAARRRAVPDDQPQLGLGAQRARRPTACAAPTATTPSRGSTTPATSTPTASACSCRTRGRSGRTSPQSRRPHRQGRDPVVHRGQPGHQVRVQGQDLAARRLRLGHQGRRPWKGYGSFGIFYDTSKLEMPRGLFGSEHSVTHYMTLDTFNWPVDPVRPSAGAGPELPGHLHRTGRPAACRQRGGQLPDRSDAEADSHARVHARPRSRAQSADALGVRYSRKRFDRTIEDTGVLVPGIGEVYRITNPGERLGENVLRDFAGCTNCPNQPKPTRNYDGVEFRFSSGSATAGS